jgi:hypothetical protein
MFGWFKKSELPPVAVEDPQEEAPESEAPSSLTIREYLHSLGSLDASALAEKGRGHWSECPVDSPCGQAMVAVIDACQALIDLLPDLSEAESWEIWFQIERQLEIFYCA